MWRVWILVVSGKSTLFNRILLDKGVGLSEEDRVDYAESIFNLTIRSMQLLLREAEDLAKDGAQTLVCTTLE